MPPVAAAVPGAQGVAPRHRTLRGPLVVQGARPPPARARPRRPAAPTTRAAPSPPPQAETAVNSPLVDALQSLSRTTAYRGPLQIGVFLVVFMIFDAAWSGDWSRIGAISKDTEAALKPVTAAITAVHAASGAVAFRAASARGASPLWPTAKALAVGVLAALEAVWDGDESV